MSNGCSKKHLKLSCWLIGVILTIAIAVSVAIGSAYGRMATDASIETRRLKDDLEPKVRNIENAIPAIDVKLEGMQRSLERIEQKLDE